MSLYLGLDTSNYTTSICLYDGNTSTAVQNKRLLPVKDGKMGLRQSDAVFLHVRQLTQTARQLVRGCAGRLAAVGVSDRPGGREGSYMPCFLVGKMAGELLADCLDIPCYTHTHQCGHIAAALYSAGQLSLMRQSFLAFHVSGGTTDCLLVQPDAKEILHVEQVGTSLDLNAGQAVDRVGAMLGLPFPAGPALDRLAQSCMQPICVKPVLKGGDCCLSGVENQCAKLLQDGAEPSYVARYCIESILAAVSAMTEYAMGRHSGLPVLYAGGVMSNHIIQETLSRRFRTQKVSFAQPEYSCDNAVGAALLAYQKHCREQ